MTIKRYERVQRIILPEIYGMDEMKYKIVIALYKPNSNPNSYIFNLDMMLSIENTQTIRVIKEQIGQYDSEEIGKLNFDNVVKNYKRKVKENFNELLQ